MRLRCQARCRCQLGACPFSVFFPIARAHRSAAAMSSSSLTILVPRVFPLAHQPANCCSVFTASLAPNMRRAPPVGGGGMVFLSINPAETDNVEV